VAPEVPSWDMRAGGQFPLISSCFFLFFLPPPAVPSSIAFYNILSLPLFDAYGKMHAKLNQPKWA
jgi:hypothetical protein